MLLDILPVCIGHGVGCMVLYTIGEIKSFTVAPHLNWSEFHNTCDREGLSGKELIVNLRSFAICGLLSADSNITQSPALNTNVPYLFINLIAVLSEDVQFKVGVELAGVLNACNDARGIRIVTI